MLRKLKSKIGFNPLRWLVNTRRMAKLLDSFQFDSERKPRQINCAILVTPWQGTSVPWFSVGIGLLLARHGQKVTFILDDFPFGNNSLRYGFVLHCLKFVLKRLANRHPVIILSKQTSTENLTDNVKAEVLKLAVLNTVWELRGEMIEPGREAFQSLCEKQLLAAYPAIKSVTTGNRFDLLFMPGGVWGTTGIWASCAKAAKIRIGSFDSGGYGTAMLAVNGVACQLQDIPKAFALINEDDDVEASTLLATREALAEMERRRAGVDPFLSQVVGSHGGDSRYEGGILIALNSSWDSAALGLHTVFENNSDWIVSTVRYLLQNTDVPVIVRQHPAERLEIAHTTDNYRLLLNRNFGSHPRLHFIAAEDKINSYALMSKVKALVVYTSTIGIEAAANLKPVITPSSSYYSELGFVFKAGTSTQYHELLMDACTGNLKVSEKQRADALICYYLTQCCNWVFSPFNPADYSEWSLRSFDEWYLDRNSHKMIRALTEGLPIAYLNHRDRLTSASSVRPER